MRRLVIALVIASTVASASAEPARPAWYEGPRGRERILHLAITGGFGLAFLLSETVFKPDLAGSSCRWCDPPAFDRAVRDALVWDNTHQAHVLSSVDAYVVAPVVGLGLLVLSSPDTSLSRLIDDTLPVAETVAMSQVVTQLVKFTVRRQRPYAHFGNPPPAPGIDDNASFWSGHSALGFSITASAGLIAHWRHYWTEPYVWGAGIALSVSTEYLRIAADRHYLSDVIVGGLVGVGSGLLIPRLLRHDVQLVPLERGAAVVGQF